VPDQEIRFNSANPHKIDEAQSILSEAGVIVIPVTHRIEELQTADAVRLVRDKALKAFDLVRRPSSSNTPASIWHTSKAFRVA
jgi:inosine/xanthosine triphosphate pyrophosphatase family protein